MLKNSCVSKISSVLCAAFAPVAHCGTRISHETELRQRDPLCTVAHQPRRGSARMHEAKRSPAKRTQPVHAHLITVGLPGRSATPISRGNANALGSQVPGAFCFQRSQRKRMQRKSSATPANNSRSMAILSANVVLSLLNGCLRRVSEKRFTKVSTAASKNHTST